MVAALYCILASITALVKTDSLRSEVTQYIRAYVTRRHICMYVLSLPSRPKFLLNFIARIRYPIDSFCQLKLLFISVITTIISLSSRSKPNVSASPVSLLPAKGQLCVVFHLNSKTLLSFLMFNNVRFSP